MVERILLIGGAGLVGRHVRMALAERDVITTYNRSPVEGGVPLDITDAAAVQALVAKTRPDAVILAAADPFVERCEREPEATRRINVDATDVIRAAAPDAMLVVFSSEYVFDGTHGPYVETDPVAPLNVYGAQKVELEDIARRTAQHLVLRVSGVFGHHPRRLNFVWQVVDRLRGGGTFDVPDDQEITPTDAASLGTTVVELLDQGLTGTFHAAGPEVIERVAFARLIARTFGLPEERIIPRPSAELGLLAKRPAQAGLSDAKLRAALGHGNRPTALALGDLRDSEVDQGPSSR